MLRSAVLELATSFRLAVEIVVESGNVPTRMLRNHFWAHGRLFEHRGDWNSSTSAGWRTEPHMPGLKSMGWSSTSPEINSLTGLVSMSKTRRLIRGVGGGHPQSWLIRCFSKMCYSTADAWR